MKTTDVIKATGWLARDGKYFVMHADAVAYNKTLMSSKDKILEVLELLPENAFIEKLDYFIGCDANEIEIKIKADLNRTMIATENFYKRLCDLVSNP